MIVNNDESIWVTQKYTFIHKSEQYNREADFAKIFRNSVNFRVNVRIHVKIADKHFL